MKFLKRFLCLMLMIPFALCLVACKDKDDDKDKDDGKDNSPEIVQLSTSEILSFAFDSFDAHSKTEKTGTNAYSAKNGNVYIYSSYEEYAFSSMKLLKELSKVENLQENVWLESNEFESATTGNVGKLSKFFVTSENTDDIQTVEVYMKFEIEGFDSTVKTKTFDTFAYNIKYYPRVESVQVETMIEKSRNNTGFDEDDSKSDLFVFQYKNGEIYATSFTRNWDIDYVELLNLINHSSIDNYEVLKFDATTNTVVVNIVGFDDENSYGYENIQKEVQKWLQAFVALNETIDDAEVSTESKFDTFSNDMRLLVNGIKKAQA